MRCTEWLTTLVFTLLLVTSASVISDNASAGESVTHLETLLIQHLQDEEEFSRNAAQYLSLTGQDSILFVDNLAGNYSLPWLNLIQQFQHSLPDCSEEFSLLESVLNFLTRKSLFVAHSEEQWRGWLQQLEKQPDHLLLHWLVREWLRFVPGGGHRKAEQFWQSWLAGQPITPEVKQLGQLYYPAPCQNEPKQSGGAFGLPGANANTLHDRGGGSDVVIRPGGSIPSHSARQELEHAARFHNFAASHPSQRGSTPPEWSQTQESAAQKSFEEQLAEHQQQLNSNPLSTKKWQAMISLLKSILPKASNPEEVEQVIKSHENQLARVETHHAIMARFHAEPVQARKDHIAFLENEGRLLFSEARRQHELEAAQWEIRCFETFEALSRNRQQMAMGEYHHWLEHNMVEFTSLGHHPQLTVPIRWEQHGAQLSGRVCHRKAGCFKKTWASDITALNEAGNLKEPLTLTIKDSGITALSEADNPEELQNQNTLMVLLDGVADLEKLRRQALAEIQAQQQQLTEENRLIMALETFGRGEDPFTQGIERATESMVRISYQHFPQGTEWVLNALSHVDIAIDATVEYIDGKSGHRFSASWHTLDETTQARILGTGKLLSVLVPIAKVKALTGVAKVPKSAGKKVDDFAGGLCFVEGTPVHTQDGLKPIEEIKVGDLVAAKDEITGEISWKPVVNLFENENRKVVKVTLVDSEGNEETIGATLEHPFWVDGRGWVEASKLSTQDQILNLSGKRLDVVQVVPDAKEHTTYNFEVQSVHTYFVGEHGAWVHNASKITSPNQLNQQIQKGSAPKGLDRVHVGKVKGEQAHIHFKDGSALNIDGTWKHGGTKLTRQQEKWVKQNGWNLPKE